MSLANKDQADECIRIASSARQGGDLDKAIRMLEKSMKLYPSDTVRPRCIPAC